MRLNDEELSPAEVKAWLIAMNTDAKAGKAVFVINQCSLPARARMGASKASSGTQWTFKGGEKLAVQSVFEERDVHRSATTVKISFTPAPTQLNLLQEGFASMSLDLEKAFPFFDDLQEWVTTHAKNAPARLAKTEQPRAIKAPKVDEFRQSEEWGAW